MQYVAFGDDDDRRGDAGMARGFDRRGAPIGGVGGPAQVMAREPGHRVAGQDAVALGIFRVAGAGQCVVANRIHQRLQPQSRAAGVARQQRHDRGEIGAGAVAVDAQPFGVGAKARGVGMDPFERGERILHRRREFVLRPHPVVDRGDQCADTRAQVAGDEIVGVEAADDVAAAMVVDDRRRRRRRVGPVEAQADSAGRAGDLALLNPRHRQRLGLARPRRRLHLGARLGRGHVLDRPQLGLGHRVQHLDNLRMEPRHRRPPLLRGDGGGLRRFRVQFAQPRHDLLGEESDVLDRVGMVEKAALAEHQQVPEPADAVVQRLDLVVDVVGRAGKAGAALDQLLDRRRRLVDRVAVPVADKAAALAAGLEHRDVGRERVVPRRVGELLGHDRRGADVVGGKIGAA